MKSLLRSLICMAATVFFNINAHAQVTKTLNGVVRYESGMSNTSFETPNGTVTVKLPQSLSGNTISGTVITEPSGRTEKEKNRNAKELMKLSVMLGAQKIQLSSNASGFNWSTQPGQQTRTQVSLVNASGTIIGEASLPAVLPAATINTGNAVHLSTPSKVLLKGDALNVYTSNQFTGAEKFMLTDSKGQQFTVSPVTFSAQQAVLNVPDASTGKCTVSVLATNQPLVNTSFNLVDISLSSPNTNLRSGQQSSVMATVTGLSTTSQPGLYINLQNLDPKTVIMEGGNTQRIYTNGTTITRNITGITAGSFSVTASLHEDYSTSNDPFRPQLNETKTPEDFNKWTNALKKDLQQYANAQTNTTAAQVIKTNTQRAIDNMPVCTSASQLDECKAVAYSLIQPLLYEVKPFYIPTPPKEEDKQVREFTKASDGIEDALRVLPPNKNAKQSIFDQLMQNMNKWIWINWNLKDSTWTASNVPQDRIAKTLSGLWRGQVIRIDAVSGEIESLKLEYQWNDGSTIAGASTLEEEISIFDQLMKAINTPHDNTDQGEWSWMKWSVPGWSGYNVDSIKYTALTPADMKRILSQDLFPPAYFDVFREVVPQPQTKPDKNEKKGDDRTRGLEDPIKLKWDNDGKPITPYDKMTDKEKKRLLDMLKKVFDKILDDMLKAGLKDKRR